MFKIEPIDNEGKLDFDFFSSEDYKSESNNLSNYLKREGFDEQEGKFYIEFRGRSWEVLITKTK